MGNLQPYASYDSEDVLYEVREPAFGSVIGYATTEGATTPEYALSSDPVKNKNNLPVAVYKPTNATEVARIYNRKALVAANHTGRSIRFAPPNAAALYDVAHEHEVKLGIWFNQRKNYVSIYAEERPTAASVAKKSAKK